jgi:hypothetical protein
MEGNLFSIIVVMIMFFVRDGIKSLLENEKHRGRCETVDGLENTTY